MSPGRASGGLDSEVRRMLTATNWGHVDIDCRSFGDPDYSPMSIKTFTISLRCFSKGYCQWKLSHPAAASPGWVTFTVAHLHNMSVVVFCWIMAYPKVISVPNVIEVNESDRAT